MDKKIDISLVTACLNEEEVLETFLDSSKKQLENTKRSWEMIIVDDGSKDKTWEIITKANNIDKRIRGIKLTRNFGHQAALSKGMETCRGNIVITIDADMQDPPELIPKILESLEKNNAEIAYGIRPKRNESTLTKGICYKSFYKLLNIISECPITPDSGDFRAMTRKVVDTLNQLPEKNKFLRGLCSWTGFKSTEFVYTRAQRYVGTPSYTWWKLLSLAKDGIIGFSTKPLRLATILALGLGLISTILILWLFIGGIIGTEAPKGWTSLSIIILLCSSANLLVLGIIGEYIGQILKQSKNRPEIVVETLTTN